MLYKNVEMTSMNVQHYPPVSQIQGSPCAATVCGSSTTVLG